MKYPSITELVLRDGQQSLIATRMRLSDMTPILSKLDNIGFSSLEMWGGATYDCCLRFLNEDPWERLKVIKSNVTKTQLQMLLRGKNLVGYKKYDDTVIDLFIKKSSENGIDIFRIFDALNDINNIVHSIECANKYNANSQGTISYTTSPIHNEKYWLKLAKDIEDAFILMLQLAYLMPQILKLTKQVSIILIPPYHHSLISMLIQQQKALYQ